MATTRIEELLDTYVVVPDFVDGGYGMMQVVRGDMTEEEWKTWNRVRNIPEVKRLVNSGSPNGLSIKLLDFLTEKGILACRTNQARPIM